VTQRINASRVVVSVNMKSPATENLRSVSPHPHNQRQNRMNLRSVGESESPPASSIVADSMLAPDRRMSRRKISNQGIRPLDLVRNRAVASPHVQPTVETIEEAPIQLVPDMTRPAHPETKADYNKSILVNAPAIAVVSPPPEGEELEDAYVIDRPVYLLSQKYFCTRY